MRDAAALDPFGICRQARPSLGEPLLPATTAQFAPQDDRLAALMLDAQRGDKRSYALLLAECEPLIRRVARRTGASGDLVEDVVQETLITLHNARQTYDPSRSFSAWLSVMAQRRAIDQLRRAGRRGRREVHAPLAYEQHADADADAASGWHEAGRSRELIEAVAELTPGQREAVEHIGLRGRSLAEAAAVTGKSKGALKVNFHRALATLKRRMAGRDDE